MLLFIALANVEAHIWGRPLSDFGFIGDGSALDRVLLFFEQLLVHERSRPMFAILYGFGLAMMASRITLRGAGNRDAKRIVRRRSWFLIVFGVAHAALLFSGDILAPYGVTGLIVAAFIGRSDKTLRAWMWGSLAFLITVGGPAFALFSSSLGGSLAVDSSEPAMGSSYGESILLGLGSTAFSMILTGLLGIYVPLTLAGMLIFRAGWLQSPGDHLPVLRKVAVSGMAVGVATALPIALIACGVWAPSPWVHAAVLWLTLGGGMYAGLGYVAAFALLAHAWRGRGRTGVPGALAALGARSLSGYLGQSILMAPLLGSWGLALGDGMGYAGAFAVAIGAWLVTVAIASWLDRHGRRGPFEIALRRLTYGRAMKGEA